MTRLNIAFVVPAGFLGCLTMSAALVVGHAEIAQLRPHERRMVPVVETAESPFRVIAGVHVPDTAPSPTSVPSPSAATAPDAASPVPADAVPTPSAALLPTAEIPSEVPQPSWVHRRADRVAAATPEPARGLLGVVIATGFDTLHVIMDAVEYDRRTDEAHAAVDPVYEEAVSPTRPARREATAAAQGQLDAARG